jgi:hypothetical protein
MRIAKPPFHNGGLNGAWVPRHVFPEDQAPAGFPGLRVGDAGNVRDNQGVLDQEDLRCKEVA